MTVCKIPVQFIDSKEPMVLSDPELIKKIPLVERAINAYNPDWETTDTIVKTPLVIPFAKRGGKFVLDNMLKYQTLNKKSIDFEEARNKTFAEYSEIMDVAQHMGCEDFLLCFDYGIFKWLCDNMRNY
ncbi:hypothetical protein GCK72_008302 [Caenorhabditis remanei]|uniref:Uncharacterized protein n=1 Tax=Caenorhabditis remanei TaxID=31234 RepID=A0A6A5GZW3_CAERE|nr:hypothetical protein GCK72_008302 [Caenorhabditis remanei]KAF1760056.1 hypothetical protein GCK72_008302 [Caenorhabditis remanei]